MKTKQLLLILMLVCSGVVSQAQISKDVHWIHGLGGDNGSWESTADLFQNERRINTAIRNTYETGLGVAQMASEIGNADQNVRGANLIGITHSMGGVAARHIDCADPTHFGAIITYGSPLRGARIVNAVASGESEGYISNGINKLNRGPFAQGFLFWPVIMGVIAPDFLANQVVRKIANSLSLHNQTVPDLSEESSYNQSFYGTATATPKVFVWGDEDSPVHVRLAASFIGWDDNSTVNAWNDARYYYGFMEDYNRALGYAPWAFLERWRCNEWQAGHEYMFSQSEGEWRAMIGASYVQTSYYSVWAPYWGTTEEQLMYCADNNLFGGDCPYLYEMTYTFQEFFNTPTDGVVPVRSQIAENTAWRPVDPNYIRRLAGDNHQSMRSSDPGRNELRAAFNQTFGPAFRIDVR